MSDDHSEHPSVATATTSTTIATTAPVATVPLAPPAVAAATVEFSKAMYPSISSGNATQQVNAEHLPGIAGSATTATPTPTPPTTATLQNPGDGSQHNPLSPGGNMQVDHASEYTISQISESVSRSANIDDSLSQRQQEQGQASPHRSHMRRQSYGSRGSSLASGADRNSPGSAALTIHESEELRRGSISSSSLAHQAQFTFSSPTQANTQKAHAQSLRAIPREHPTQGQSRPSERPAEYHPGGVPFPPQVEEDIRMSESPSPDDNDSSKDSVSYYRRDSDGFSGGYPEGGIFQIPGAHHAQFPGSPHDDARSTSSPLCTDSESIGLGGVTMPAKSAVLYHAGYNSGRGAVWRFFKVVEARVSGNTDRAECLLCQKRMLGKSADMKKHIILSCPFRREISSDMQPILAIVRAELENPKKRAKRNSNTPIVMRPDGTFVADATAYTGSTYTDSSLTARLQAANTANLQHHRSPSHPRPGPYDFHSEAHRAKMARHSRDQMRPGQAGSRMEGLGIGSSSSGPSGGAAGGPEPNIQRFGSPLNAHSHVQSAMPMPPPGHPTRGQPMPMQHTFAPRHPSHPGHPGPQMMPNMQQPPPPPPQRQTPQQPMAALQAQPPRQLQAPPQQQQQQQPAVHQQPLQQRAQRLSPPQHQQQQQQPPQQPPVQQPQPPSRYYAPGQGGPSHLTHALPHGTSPRQGGPPQTAQSAAPRLAPPSGSQLGRLRARLRQRIPVFGVWLSIPSVATARMLAAQNFDWACIDMEHSPTNPALMAEMVAAVASSGTCVPIVRVPSHSPEWIKWALDAGAHGIIIPHVETPDEMRHIVSLCNYPPIGKRSIGAPFAPHAFGIRGPRAVSEYMDTVSSGVMVIPQIESMEGAANLKGILAVGGVDAVFVGPYNLGASVRAAQEMSLPEVFATIEKTAGDCDMPIGIYSSSGESAWSKMKDGYTLLVAASDVDCLASSALDNLERAKGEPPRQYR
ncbi:hypothetical protein GGI20_000587 [Coemansia sp. BCRC 34301]|nr:hypothetical protein GGI20_000587 [Coemansia sp. BCRC 34301]